MPKPDSGKTNVRAFTDLGVAWECVLAPKCLKPFEEMSVLPCTTRAVVKAGWAMLPEKTNIVGCSCSLPPTMAPFLIFKMSLVQKFDVWLDPALV